MGEIWVKWSIPEKVIERGRTYLNEGRVLSVTPDPANKVWHAVVLGSEEYLVDLDATAKEEDYCQCPYWEEHHYCKHTVAVELFLRQQGKTRFMSSMEQPVKSKFSTAEMFTNGFAKLKFPAAEGTAIPLRLQFNIDAIETNPYHKELAVFGISLKVGQRGTTRNYIVKNIYKFLQAYSEQKKILINKQHSFLIEPQAFTPDVNEALTVLWGMAQTQQLMGQTGILVNGKLDKKYLLVPIGWGQKLLEMLGKLGATFGYDEKKLSPILFSDAALPLAFSVKKDKEQFVLAVEKDYDQVFNYYHWGIIDEKIHPLSSCQQEIYLTLDQLLKRIEKKEIPYAKKELSVLFKQVLPLLRQIGEVNIATEVYQYISDEDLAISFILRKKKGQIAVELQFSYGDAIFSSNVANNMVKENQPEVLRDYQKEDRARHLLQQQGYEENEAGFVKNLPTGSDLYYFFTRELPTLQQLGTVKLGKKLRELYLDAHKIEPEVKVDSDGSWLDVHFDISGIGEKEIDNILRSLLNQDAFYTLTNGQILSLETPEFQETSAVLQKLRQTKSQDGVIKMPLNQGLVLQDQLKAANVSFSDDFTQMVKDLTHPENYPAQLPAGLNADLRPYQVTGFRWLKMLSHYQFGGILADEMGLGKTLQTIAYLLSEKQADATKTTLIVAPASLTFNWLAELKKFAPSLKAAVVGGNKQERMNCLAQEVDIYITSYASLRQDIDLYRELSLDQLILDEAQMVKNAATKTAKALRSLVIPHRFALSGTPIENNLEELWSLFEMIMPGFFPSQQRYRQLSAEQIAQMIKPFVLRRDKATVLKDLPEKLETNYYSALTEDQKKIYLAYLRQMREEISQMDAAAFKKNRISILAGLTRLRQICCDPKLFIDDYEGTSGKLEQVKDLIQAAKENGRRVLLFSQFTGMLTIIEEELAKLGYESFYLRGSTPPKNRIEMVNAFNQGEKDVFLISLKAGGTGLNLTGADTVILYDLWWNPAVEEQAAGRAHRIGQEKVVEVWRMIAEGTIEERMNALQQDKRELFQKVIQGNETQLQQLTEADIRMILSAGE
jgi:SNF2 family DNA or RNA helicase